MLNDLRLVLGTRLGVVDDGDDESFDPEDADAAAKVVYAYTGFLEAQFIDVLAEALPDVPDESAPAADPDASATRTIPERRAVSRRRRRRRARQRHRAVPPGAPRGTAPRGWAPEIP